MTYGGYGTKTAFNNKCERCGAAVHIRQGVIQQYCTTCKKIRRKERKQKEMYK